MGVWRLNLQHSSPIPALRHHFQSQPDLPLTPIEKIRLPLKSRDELPPILAGLQWIRMHPTLKTEIFSLLEAKVRRAEVRLGGKGIWEALYKSQRLWRKNPEHLTELEQERLAGIKNKQLATVPRCFRVSLSRLPLLEDDPKMGGVILLRF